MQLDGNKLHSRTLADLAQGEEAILDAIDLPEDLSTRLMELGFVPGEARY